jgi:hypothetical protein
VLCSGLYAVVSQLADILRRLARIETELEDHSRRTARLEEKSRVVEITVGRRGRGMVRFGQRGQPRSGKC